MASWSHAAPAVARSSTPADGGARDRPARCRARTRTRTGRRSQSDHGRLLVGPAGRDGGAVGVHLRQHMNGFWRHRVGSFLVPARHRGPRHPACGAAFPGRAWWVDHSGRCDDALHSVLHPGRFGWLACAAGRISVQRFRRARARRAQSDRRATSSVSARPDRRCERSLSVIRVHRRRRSSRVRRGGCQEERQAG